MAAVGLGRGGSDGAGPGVCRSCLAVGRRALWALPGGGSMCLEGGGKGEVGLAGLSLGR